MLQLAHWSLKAALLEFLTKNAYMKVYDETT